MANHQNPQCTSCPTTCVKQFGTVVTSRGDDTFIITIPQINHGFLEMAVPCSCAVAWDNAISDTGFPCEAHWTATNVTFTHVIPSHWVPENDTILSSILVNTSLAYKQKIESVLNATWKVTQSPSHLTPETTYEDLNYYQKVKTTAQEIHIEWSVVITIMIIIIIFRKPLNALLVRIVSKKKYIRGGGKNRGNDEHIQRRHRNKNKS